MALTLLSVLPKHERRIRCVFSGPLAVGAFVVGPYDLAPNSSGGAPVSALEAVAVPGSSNVVELVLDTDLAAGEAYTLTCTSVPGTDLSTYSGPFTFRYGTPRDLPNRERPAEQVGLAVFLRDLAWNGSDYHQTPEGDLATVEGRANVHGALDRRIKATKLPWNSAYGGALNSAVDGPMEGQLTLRGRLLAQLYADPRVAIAKCTVETIETLSQSAVVFQLEYWLRDGTRGEGLSASVEG